MLDCKAGASKMAFELYSFRVVTTAIITSTIAVTTTRHRVLKVVYQHSHFGSCQLSVQGKDKHLLLKVGEI